MKPETMTADDFLTGLLAGLALRNYRELDVGNRRFDEALAHVYEALLDMPAASDMDIDFQVNPDPIHGDSSVIQEALSVAVQGRVVGRVNPTFRRLRINLSDERAGHLLDRLPGGSDLYQRLTELLVERFQEPARA